MPTGYIVDDTWIKNVPVLTPKVALKSKQVVDVEEKEKTRVSLQKEIEAKEFKNSQLAEKYKEKIKAELEEEFQTERNRLNSEIERLRKRKKEETARAEKYQKKYRKLLEDLAEKSDADVHPDDL